MRNFLAAALIGTAAVAATASQTTDLPRFSDSLERTFAPNGTVRMDLSAGDYRISPSSDNRIRMEWSVRRREDLARVRAIADVGGRDANIVTYGPHNGFKVTIEVPAHADLYVRLSAGELTIKGVRGNKDVELHAGELDIDVGRADDYKRVDASVWAGEVHAAPFNVETEGLFRSFDWSGRGAYRLHAHLKAGEVRLRGANGHER